MPPRPVHRAHLDWLAPCLALALLAAACGSEPAAFGADAAPADAAEQAVGRLPNATTVAPIPSIVTNVGGDRADVVGIVPEGTNSHTFEPQPSVAELLATADLVVVNGLQLEEPTVELAEANMSADAQILEVGTESIPESEWIYDVSFPEEEGKPNPHLWTDPRYAVAYAQAVAEKVSELDPTSAEYYMENAEQFAAYVDEFDAAMRTAFATIPDGQRELLTYHDAYAYFAEDYGWDVIGAIQVSSFEDPTPREVADLITQVREEDVPAIFGSEVFPSPVLEQISRETGATYVDDLRDDDLPGAPGDPEHSWAGLMRFDYITMTEALGGDPSALEGFELRRIAPDEAVYPQ